MVAGSLTSLPVPAEATTASPISAETRVSQRQVTIGDIITYSIVVRHDPGIHVMPPDPAAHFEKGFESIDKGTSKPREAEGQREETFWFRLRADAVGFYNLPEVPVQFTAPSPDDPSHPIPGVLQAPAAVIEVRSVLYQDGTPSDIKDIKPIIGAGWNWQKYLQWALLVLATLGAIAGFCWWLKQQKKTSAPKPSTVARDLKPHEIAFAELDHLLARNLLNKGQVQEHYFVLSEILRRYLGALLSIPALDWTTEEIGAYVSGQNTTQPELQRTILTLLPVTDQIKFAKAPIDHETALQHVEAVRKFIRTSTPELTSKYQVKSTATV